MRHVRHIGHSWGDEMPDDTNVPDENPNDCE